MPNDDHITHTLRPRKKKPKKSIAATEREEREREKEGERVRKKYGCFRNVTALRFRKFSIQPVSRTKFMSIYNIYIVLYICIYMYYIIIIYTYNTLTHSFNRKKFCCIIIVYSLLV